MTRNRHPSRPTRPPAGPCSARHHADRPRLADRGAAADAAEQPRPRGRRAPRRARRLRRHRQGRPRLAAASTRSSARSPTLKPDETLLVQSGRPVGVMQTHEWAPRVLIANSNLVGDWANWEEFRRLEQLGLTMYGQMTAGLVDLHRHPGHPAGHLRDVRRGRRQDGSTARSPARSRSPPASAAWAARSRSRSR